MNSLPTVSVVVPAFNGEASIAACVRSLLAMEYPAGLFEIVVVDNASTDGTARILSSFAEQVKLLHEKKRGPAAARNQGVRHASGEVIAFTDSDCTVEKSWLRHLVAAITTSEVGIAGGRILSRRPHNRIEAFGEQIHDHEKAINLYKPPYVITMNWASPRAVLLQAGLFDETYLRCEDVDLSQRIFLLGYKLVYQSEAVVYHENENTLGGLFREGYQHGVWAVKCLKDSRDLTHGNGHRRLNLQSYKGIATNLAAAVKSERRVQALCQATFDVGKKCGKVAGSARFGYIDL